MQITKRDLLSRFEREINPDLALAHFLLRQPEVADKEEYVSFYPGQGWTLSRTVFDDGVEPDGSAVPQYTGLQVSLKERYYFGRKSSRLAELTRAIQWSSQRERPLALWQELETIINSCQAKGKPLPFIYKTTKKFLVKYMKKVEFRPCAVPAPKVLREEGGNFPVGVGGFFGDWQDE